VPGVLEGAVAAAQQYAHAAIEEVRRHEVGDAVGVEVAHHHRQGPRAGGEGNRGGESGHDTVFQGFEGEGAPRARPATGRAPAARGQLILATHDPVPPMMRHHAVPPERETNGTEHLWQDNTSRPGVRITHTRSGPFANPWS